jgi:hypothetical protein
MIPLTYDELGALLTETFTAHEHLADPDRAAELAAAPAPPRHLGRVLLGAAAAVALVAGGTAYVASQGGDAGRAIVHGPGPTTGRVPPGTRSLTTDAENRAAAEHLVNAAMASLQDYPGVRAVGSIPELRTTSAAIPDVQSFTASRLGYWTVRGSARSVAAWYATHPPTGFRVQGGAGTVDGEGGSGAPSINDVYLVQPGHDLLPPSGVQIVVQTVQLAQGVGIRATATAVWRPARPAESFVDHVTSIDVHEQVTRYGRNAHRSRHDWTIDSPSDLRAVVTTFNRLPGWPPLVHGCFPIRVVHRYRVAFRTDAGSVIVTGTISCYDDLAVRRDGRRVGPLLDDGSRLAAALRAAR